MTKAPIYQPPIHTADDKPLVIGMTVYGIDVCDDSKLGIKQLKVIDVSLGRTREVRLRRKDGIEWTWSANSSRTACSNGTHLVYASKSECQSKLDDVLKRKAYGEYRAIPGGVDYAERELKRHHQSVMEYQRKLATLKKRKSALERKYPGIATASVTNDDE